MKVSLKTTGRGICLALTLALCAAGASAQQPQAGAVHGQLSDEFGGVIVGATVTATNSAGVVVKTTTTDGEGNFTVNNLAPGKYAVRAVAPGFAFYENADVAVGAARTDLGKITLAVSLEKEEVTVASESPVSVDNASAGAIVLKGKDLEALPDDPDELAAALSALAGPAAGPNGGQILIDGFEGGRIPSKDSIREIRINDNPLSAERDQPGFGGIQIFTKPGTDKLRGSLGGTFNDESMNSRNPFLRSPKRPPFQFRQYSGNLSGTIAKKKASFFLDFERNETDDNDLINATVLDPVTLQPTGFNQAVLTPLRRFSISPRIDYAINQKNTLVARYNFFTTTQENLGVSQFSLPERAFDQKSHTHLLQLTETAVLNKTTVNETRFQFIRSRFEQDPHSTATAVNVIDAFSNGGATVGNSFNETTRWEVTNTTTQAHGLHSVKYGARLRGVTVDDSSENNFNGTFTFSTLADFRSAVLHVPTAIPAQLSIAGGTPLARISQLDFGGFVQDDWKLRPNLTLGGGLRYEAQTNISSHFNFAPRVYVAWSPDGGAQKQAKTVIRAGFGIFYDRVAENLSLQAERFNGVNQQQFLINAPRDNDASDAALRARALLGLFPVIPTVDQLNAFKLTQTMRRLAPGIEAPYSYISGFILTRQLTKTTILNVFASTYNTRHVLRSRNVNAPLVDAFNIPLLDASHALIRPQAALGNVFQYESSGTQNMEQFNVSLSKQFNRAVSITANYTLSKMNGNADAFGGGAAGFPVNQYDLTGEYGRTSFDVRHRFILFGSLGVPRLKLSLNPIIIANTGRPFNIVTGFDNNADSIFNDRPAFADAQTRMCPAGVIPRPPFVVCDGIQTRLGNFDVNPKAGQKIIPRNFGEAPGFFAVNLRVGRTFGFGETAASKAAAAAKSAQQQQAQNSADGRQGQGGDHGGRGGGGGGRGGEGGNRGGGGGGGRPGGGMVAGGMGGPMMIMMGGPGGTEKRYNINLSLNFINLLNHTNFGPPVGTLSSPSFGQSTYSVGGFGGFGGNQAAGNRRIQASVRFSF